MIVPSSNSAVTVTVAVRSSAYTFEPDAQFVTDKDAKTINYPFTATASPLATGSVLILTLPYWLSDTNPETLEFEVEANDTEVERQATVTVQYTAPDGTVFTKDLVIRQSAGYL